MAEISSVEFKPQIIGLLKDNEKIQSNPEVPPSEDDTEIKKIKKVRSARSYAEQKSDLLKTRQLKEAIFSSFIKNPSEMSQNST